MTTLSIEDGSRLLQSEMSQPLKWVRRQERDTPKPTAEYLRDRWRALLRERGVTK